MGLEEFETKIYNNYYLRGLRSKNKSGIRIICLHGFLDNCHSFIPLVNSLESNKYSFYLLDLPGHGKSSFKSDDIKYYDLLSVAIDIKTFTELSNEPTYFIGHSLGAAIILLMLAIDEKIAEKVIFIDNLAPQTSESDTFVKRINNFSRSLTSNRGNYYYKSIDDAIHARSKNKISIKLAKLLANRSVIKNEKGYFWNFDKKLLRITPYRFTKAHIIELIRNISTEILYLESNQDDFLIRKNTDFEDIFSSFSNLKKISIDGGHHEFAENPDLFTDYIKNFLQSS